MVPTGVQQVTMNICVKLGQTGGQPWHDPQYLVISWSGRNIDSSAFDLNNPGEIEVFLHE